MSSKYDKQLQVIPEIQGRIADIHPFLAQVFPVAVAEDDQFFVFDIVPPENHFTLVAQAPIPMPVPQGVRAAFPLECYGDKITCVVTGEVFDSLEGYVTIFHEFIHCQQFETCEHELKQMLVIARRAQDENDHMWEINHPFPYDTPRFAELYTQFLMAVAKEEERTLSECRKQLRETLSVVDYEYMIWQEWKEGFARFIENRIRSRVGLGENHSGKEEPYTRVSFYEGGAHLIEYVVKGEPQLAVDIERLFGRMLQGEL